MSDYGYVKGNAGLYDGGFQAVLFDRILVSARGRAVYDLSTNTFMLMNHFYDTTLDLSENAPFYTDIQGWQLPQNMNGPGIRVGFIGKHYEIAYSQGDFMHGIPKSLIAKFNLPNIDLRFLYGHENRNAPASWTNELSSHLVQVRGGKTVFNLEYAVYGKFQAASSEFTIGFQGSTDGRYYIAGGIKF